MLSRRHVLSLIVCGALSVTMLAQATEVEKFPIIAGDSRSQGYPRISGDRVVYNSNTGGSPYPSDFDVDGYNILADAYFSVDADTSKDSQGCVSGRYVTWVKMVGTDQHIYVRDVVGGGLYPVCTEPGGRESPQISGSMVVWYDTRDGKKAIYGYDLSSPGEFVIVADKVRGNNGLGLDGDILVWADERSGTRRDIYGYNLSTHSEFLVSGGVYSAGYPDVSGNVAVFSSYRTTGPNIGGNIYGYNISTSQEFAISTSLASSNLPKIDGNIVVWGDARDGAGNDNIYAKNLATGYELRVCDDPDLQRFCDVSGDIVVWQDESGYYSDDIYGAKLNIASMFVPGTFDDGTMGSWTSSGGVAQVIVDPHDPGNYCLELQTASPVTVTHDVSTPERPFYILFEYEFTTTSGTLTLELDGQLLETIGAPGTLTGLFDSYIVPVWHPGLLGLDNVPLAFTLDETGGAPSGFMLDEIDFQTVPEPVTLALLATGMLVVTARRRKRRCRPAMA